MGLYDDIQREQADLAKEVDQLRLELISEAMEGVEMSGSCKPVVAAIIQGHTCLYFPRWRNAFERSKVFENINATLEGEPVDATICAFGGSYARSFKPIDSAHSHQSRLPALIIITRTANAKDIMVVPYSSIEGSIEWLDPVPLESFPAETINYPCVD